MKSLAQQLEDMTALNEQLLEEKRQQNIKIALMEEAVLVVHGTLINEELPTQDEGSPKGSG